MNFRKGDVLAERRLLYSMKNSHARAEAVFQVMAPYSEMIGDAEGGEAFVCEIRIDGLNARPEKYFGMDAVQALQLATELDPLIKRLSAKYDFFWSTGEPYFDEAVEKGSE